jgi:hypothetical protein
MNRVWIVAILVLIIVVAISLVKLSVILTGRAVSDPACVPLSSFSYTCGNCDSYKYEATGEPSGLPEGWQNQGSVGYVYDTEVTGTSPLFSYKYACGDCDEWIYSTQEVNGDLVKEEIVGYVFDGQVSGTVPLNSFFYDCGVCTLWKLSQSVEDVVVSGEDVLIRGELVGYVFSDLESCQASLGASVDCEIDDDCASAEVCENSLCVVEFVEELDLGEGAVLEEEPEEEEEAATELEEAEEGDEVEVEADEWITYEAPSRKIRSRGGYSTRLEANERLMTGFEGEWHYVGVKNFNEDKALVVVQSDVQEVVLDKGEIRKFEVSDDEYYDLLVRYNGVREGKAGFTIQRIRELISGEESEKGRSITTFVIILVIVAVVIVFVILLLVLRKREAPEVEVCPTASQKGL